MAEKKEISPSGVLRFGVFQVNLAARELRKHGVRVRLPGQPFCILSLLLEKPGEIVTRGEMRQRLWPSDTFVDFEHSLNSAIKKLRAALGDSPENSRYVETVPRVGYRFIAPIAEVSATGPSVVAPRLAASSDGTPAKTEESRGGQLPPTGLKWPLFLGIPAVLLLVVAMYFGWSRFRNRPQSQSKVANGIPGGSHESNKPNNQPTLSPKSEEAHDLYLKGMHFWNKRSVPGFEQAIEYFQQATALEPNYAAAYAGLADSYTLLVAYNSASANLYIPQARAAALHALQLDNNLAEAHTALALILQNHDWDWQGSEKEFRRAIELNPNYPTAYQWYAEHLMWLGRFDEALAESDRAQQLDPLSLIIAADRGAILYYSRQYDRAIEQFRNVLRKDPDFVRAMLVIYAYVEKKKFPQALAEMETIRRLYGDGYWYWSGVAYIYGRAGHPERARREVERLERVNRKQAVDPVTMFWAHLGAGDKEEALADLEKAVSEHFSAATSLKVDPGFDPLRSDPRFQDLLRRVGLANANATGASTPKP